MAVRFKIENRINMSTTFLLIPEGDLQFPDTDTHSCLETRRPALQLSDVVSGRSSSGLGALNNGVNTMDR